MGAAYTVFFRKVHIHEKCVLPPFTHAAEIVVNGMKFSGGGAEDQKRVSFFLFASASHSCFSGFCGLALMFPSMRPPTSCLVVSVDLKWVPFL